jgi:hypothetical protein
VLLAIAALSLTLAGGLIAHAGGLAGHWGATEIQLQNLANTTNVITVTLWKWDGTLVGRNFYTLTAGTTAYVTPGFGGSPTGTLVINGREALAGAIAHLEGPGEVGNEVYEVNEETRWTADMYLPLLTTTWCRPVRAPPSSSTHR